MEDAKAETLPKAISKFLVLIYKILVIYVQVCVSLLRRPARKCIKGQNVLITGAGHGLGREIALKFAQLETNLVLVDINQSNNEQVKKEILEQSNGNVTVHTYSVDIRDEANVANLAKKVGEQLGDIDILINNAGIVQCLPFLELSPTLVERTFQVNSLAHIWTIKHFLSSMIKKQRGHIVGIASIAGIIGGKYLTDYW